MSELEIKGDVAYAEAMFGGQSIPICLQLDADPVASKADYLLLLDEAKESLDKLPTLMPSLTNKIAIEVNDACYEQSEYSATTEDIASLQAEIRISEAVFFEGGCVLVFAANNAFPDMLICCQLDEQFEIDDISIVAS